MSYLKKIFSTGAIRKTPERIINRIADKVKFFDGVAIVEAGAGQGEITAALVTRNNGRDMQYYAFEIDMQFCRSLVSAFPEITVLNTDVLKFEKELPNNQAIDYFISSIPLSFFKSEEIEVFCLNVSQSLKKGGSFIILFTAFWLIPILKRTLPEIKIESYFTFPPYFIGIYTKP